MNEIDKLAHKLAVAKATRELNIAKLKKITEIIDRTDWLSRDLENRICLELNHDIIIAFGSEKVITPALLEFIENWQPSKELLNTMKCKQQGEE